VQVIVVLCGPLWSFAARCGPLRSLLCFFAVLCGPLQFFAAPCCPKRSFAVLRYAPLWSFAVFSHTPLKDDGLRQWLRILVDVPVAHWLPIRADNFYLFNDLSARIVRTSVGSHPYPPNQEMQFNRHKYLNKRYLKQYQFVPTCGVNHFNTKDDGIYIGWLGLWLELRLVVHDKTLL